MQPKHHILLYTFLGLAVITAGIAAFSYGLQAQRSAQALEDAYAAYRDAKEQARELLTHRENLRPYLAPQETSQRAKRPEQIER